MKRTLYSSGAPWESTVGYSRAVRVGNTIEVAGTTAMKNGELVGAGDAYTQTTCILEIIKEAIEGLGGSMSDVVRTRMYVTDITLFEEIGRAHGKYFSDIKPASSIVEISRLVDPEMIVEIEATAILDSASPLRNEAASL